MRQTIDSSVIIKGMLKPRRKKQDEILKEQIRLHNIASSIMDKVNSGETQLIIPNVAIVEVASVASRLTGTKDIGLNTANFVKGVATIVNEADILSECIDIAADTKLSGFDNLFITCAKVNDSLLITDDRKMFNAAVKVGIDAKLLRDIK